MLLETELNSSFYNSVLHQHVNMDDFWNSNILKPPLINSFRCKSPIDIMNVKAILETAIDTFIIPNALTVESNVMRRVIYRLKLQFRLDKGFKLFEKTNRNLNQLFSFNITKDLMYFLDEVPKKYNKDFYFPSKQMLEYVLVRLQGYSQVCGRVVEAAFHTAILMKGRVRLGHQWEIAVVCIAICSRIWQICKHLTIRCCLLFNELLPLLDKLQIVGSKWLPDNYQFPKDLIEWLKYDWLIERPDIILQLPLELPIFSLLDDDENDIQYNGRYKLNKSKTIVIADDSDEEEDETGNLQFVCSFNKSYVNLNEDQVRKLQPKILVVDDSDSEAKTSYYERNGVPTTGSFENLLALLDESGEDVQIIEPTVSNSKKPKDLLNVSGVVPLNANKDVIELNDSITVDEEDTGEIISRKEFMNMNNNSKQTSAENKFKSDIYEFSDDESTSSEIEVFRNKGKIPKEESIISKKKKLQPEIEEELPEMIELNGFNYRINSAEQLEQFLEHENGLRQFTPEQRQNMSKTKRTTKENMCISSHFDDDAWHCISFEIKYAIAVVKHTEDIKQKDTFIRKAQIILKEILDVQVQDIDEDMNNSPIAGYRPETLWNEALPRSYKQKVYFIDSLETTQHLQILLEKESDLRRRNPINCFFSKVDIDVWFKASYEIKYLIMIACHKPIQRNIYIKKAKLILHNLCRNRYELSDDDSENSDVEDLRKQSRENFDSLYESIVMVHDMNKLFDHVQGLRSYIVPDKKKKYTPEEIMLRKQKKKLKKLLKVKGKTKSKNDPPVLKYSSEWYEKRELKKRRLEEEQEWQQQIVIKSKKTKLDQNNCNYENNILYDNNYLSNYYDYNCYI